MLQPLPYVPKIHHTYRIEGETWRIIMGRQQGGDFLHQLRLQRNGRTVLTKTTELELDAVILKWPYRGRLLALSSHTSAGHGMQTDLFRIDRRGVANLGVHLIAEVGGPIYRDLNQDHRPEILFDNYDWYDHWDQSPTLHIAYRYDGKRLTKYKILPRHHHLPYRLAPM